MTARMSKVDGLRRARGLTLIELMIAMVLGILVSGGIITIFVSTAKSNKALSQQARLQEEGRFAVNQLTESLRMASASYCSSSGGIAESDGPVFVDGLRTPTILASNLSLPDNTTVFGSSPYPTLPTAQYALPSYLYMRGYDCAEGACNPIDPHSIVADIPAMGTAVGNRVVGADVLTLRYLDGGQGWAIGPDDIIGQTGLALSFATMTPEPGEPALADVPTGDQLFMYADCSAAQVYSADFDGTTIATNPVGSGNMALPLVPGNPALRTAPKLFPFSQAFATVTWYLQVVDDGSAAGNTTGALMRRVNGQTQELVRGIERLDFRYGVEDGSGNTVYLTANEVDNGVGGITCPEQPPNVPADPGPYPGCLWRAIKTIEISMLVSGQQALPSLEDQALAYAYTPDIPAGDPIVPQPPGDASHTITYTEQGFPEHVLRREFSTLVSIRNYNP